MQTNQSPDTIRLGITDLSFHRVTGALIANILGRLGYNVQRSYALHEENFAKLKAGEIDMIASAWLPYSHGIYKEDVETVVPTRELGLHYEPYALWGVPEYIPSSSVRTISDLLKPDVYERMTKVIQGIGPGAGITRFSINMMTEYHLADAGYEFRTGTQEDCVQAFEQAVTDGNWTVVPLWHPQFLHSRYAIRELEDPKGLLGGKDRAILLAREDQLKAKLSEEHVTKLDRIKLSNESVSELDYAVNRRGLTDDDAAVEWCENNAELLNQWIS